MIVTADSDTTSRVISVTDPSMGDGKIMVWNRSVNPFFTVTDKHAETLGLLEGTTKVAFARKTLPDFTSWFIALPPDDIDLWRNILRRTGAHIYVDNGDVIYSGNGILTLHTDHGGEREVKLRNGIVKKIYLKPYSTTLLDSNSGEILLP
jgi:hypothetical protein